MVAKIEEKNESPKKTHSSYGGTDQYTAIRELAILLGLPELMKHYNKNKGKICC